MRKGTLVFMVLIVCSAVVVGASLSLIQNWHYITNQRSQPSAAESAPVADIPSPPVPAANPVTEPEHQPAGKSLPPVPSRSIQSERPAPDAVLVLTAAEAHEVNSMLLELGYESASVSEGIRKFQRENQLQETGFLDSDTLGAVIQQITYKKVKTLT